MVGNGQMGNQPVEAATVLPQSTISAQMVAQYGKRDVEPELDARFVGTDEASLADGGWRWGKRGS